MAKMQKHVHIRSFVFFVYLVHLMLYAAALIYLAISNKHSLSDFIQTKELTYLVYVKFGVFFLCTYFCCMEYRKLTVGLFYLAHALDMVLSLAIIVIHCLTVDREKAYYVIVMVLVICHNSFMVLVDVLGLVTLCMSVRSGNSADRYKSSLPSELKDCYLEQNYPTYTRKKKNKKKEKKNRQSEDLGFNRKGYFDTFDDVADGKDDAVVGVSYDKKNGTTKTDPFIRDPYGNPLTLEISPNGSQSPLIADEIEFAATPGNEEPPHPRESLKRHHRVVGTPSMHVKGGRRSTKKESTTIENLQNHERLLQEQQQRQQEIEMTARNQADQHETVENQTHLMGQNSQQIEQQSQHMEQQQNQQPQQLRMAHQLKKHPASERQPRKVYKHERRLSQQFSVEQLRNELRTTPQAQQRHSAILQQPTVTLQNSTTRTRSLSQSAYTLQQPSATPQDSTTRTRSISQSAYRLPSSETVGQRERRYSQQMDDIRQLKELQLQQQAQMQQMQMLLLQHQQNQILQQQQQQQVQQQSLPSATPPPPPPPPPVPPQETQQPPPTYSTPQRTAQQATPQHPPTVSQTSHVSNSSQQPPNFIPPPPPANPPAVKPKGPPPPPPSAPRPPPPSTPPPPLTKQDSHPPYFTPEKDYPEESDQPSFSGRRSTTHSRRNPIDQNSVATRQRRHSIEVGSLNSGHSVVNKYVKQYNRRLSQESDSFRISNTFKKQSKSSQDVRILARTTNKKSYTQDTHPTESGYGSFERPYMERTSSFDNLVARTSHIY